MGASAPSLIMAATACSLQHWRQSIRAPYDTEEWFLSLLNASKWWSVPLSNSSGLVSSVFFFVVVLFCFLWDCIWGILTSTFQTIFFFGFVSSFPILRRFHSQEHAGPSQAHWVTVSDRRQALWPHPATPRARGVDCTNRVRRPTRPHNRGD